MSGREGPPSCYPETQKIRTLPRGYDQAIAAKQFGEAQQKFPVAHAAAGAGKSVGKVKASAVKKSQRQGQHLGK